MSTIGEQYRNLLYQPRNPEKIRYDLIDTFKKWDIEKFGKKFQFGRKTVDQLIGVRDPITGKIKHVNLAEAWKHETGDIVSAIKGSLELGQTETEQQLANLSLAVGRIVRDAENYQKLAKKQLDVVKKAIEVFSVAPDPLEAGFERVEVTQKHIEDLSPVVEIYLLSRSKLYPELNYKTPIFEHVGSKKIPRPITELMTMEENDQKLDLKHSTIIPKLWKLAPDGDTLLKEHIPKKKYEPLEPEFVLGMEE